MAHGTWDQRSADQIAIDAQRAAVRELLERCTDQERGTFALCFPEGIDKLTPEKLRIAIDLCQRTLAQHEGGA